MPLRLTRRVPLISGLLVNLSKSGASVSVGHRGAWYSRPAQWRAAAQRGLSRGLTVPGGRYHAMAAYGRVRHLSKSISHSDDDQT